MDNDRAERIKRQFDVDYDEEEKKRDTRAFYDKPWFWFLGVPVILVVMFMFVSLWWKIMTL